MCVCVSVCAGLIHSNFFVSFFDNNDNNNNNNINSNNNDNNDNNHFQGRNAEFFRPELKTLGR